jgi:four helix bundle protein
MVRKVVAQPFNLSTFSPFTPYERYAMSKIHRFEDIEAWQMARTLTGDVYKCTLKAGFDKDCGMKDQIRRAAVSIMNNVAEGFERGSNKDFAKFLFIARGSAGEVRSLLYVAKDLGYISDTEFEENKILCCRIAGALWGLIQHLKKTSNLTTMVSILLFGFLFGFPRFFTHSSL